ncbi:DedA family protein [Salipiger sp.]|uniref:DedA family protein n=1 Tax=Salipiger sp. TaxID=2078585 RepID=UPI003A97B6C7
MSETLSDTLLGLLPTLGLPALALVVALGTLGVPLMPASLMVLVAGTLVAAGELPLAATVATCLVTAVAVDNLGYLIGRAARQRFRALDNAAMRQAETLLAERGGPAVFLTRWLLAPLGPPLNLVAGASGFPWRRFVLWDLAGETLWVTGYLSLGAAFAPFIPDIASLSGNLTGALACMVIAWIVWRGLHGHTGRRQE